MNQLALQEGAKYLIKNCDFSSTSKLILEDLVEFKPKKIILEIGFGSGENLLKSAKMNPDILYLLNFFLQIYFLRLKFYFQILGQNLNTKIEDWFKITS